MMRRSTVLCSHQLLKVDREAVRALRARTALWTESRKSSALNLRHELRQLQCEGYEIGSQCLLHCMLVEVRRQRFKSALAYHEAMLDTGERPTRTSQSLLLNAHSSLGNVKQCKLILKDMKSWQMSISTPELNMLLRAMIVADDPGAASLKRDFLHGKLQQLPNRATWPLLVRASRTVEEMEIPLAYLRNKRTLRIGVKPLALFHAICAACARDGRKKAVDWATKALTAVQKRGILGPAEYLALCDVAASARHWKVVHQTLAALSEGFDARLSPSIVVRIVQLRLDAILFNASQSKEYISRVDTYAWVTAATLFWKRNVSFASEKGWLLMMKVYDTADERASAIRLFDNARRMKKDSPKLHAAFSAVITKRRKTEPHGGDSPFFKPPAGL
ncbi:hypothetical protein DIPPA_13001 [Diplonema papillatum]|nr:hypothetical protein DIPPA_13001 [Diplonema papillatum]